MTPGITLLDVLIDGFEKNEVFGGFHWRDLPMPDEAAAVAMFAKLAAEATAWKGAPVESVDEGTRRLVRWPELQIWQAGRGVRVRVRRAGFHVWWHDDATWAGDPLGPVDEWIDERAPERA